MSVSKINLTGGLGNQLFGAFLGLSLNDKFGCQISLNTRDLNARGYQLSQFEKYFPKDLKIVNEPLIRLNGIERQLNKITKKIYFEKDFVFDEDIFTQPYQEYFGNFQSWKYFVNVEASIKTIFESLLRDLANNSSFSKYMESPYIALHVRRGDYKNLKHYHGLTSANYFKEALEFLDSKISSRVKIIVFSDEISEAKKIVGSADYYIGPQDINSNLDNLLLMANAQYLIGSNSSFSWWAAYAKEKQLSVFPKPWFQDTKLKTADLLPQDWIMIDI